MTTRLPPATPAAAPTMVPARAYPEWMEQWWMGQACRQAGLDDVEAAVKFHAGAVQVLSDLFTVARPETGKPEEGKPSAKAHFPDYGADAELAVGYGLFYFPQNFVRTRLPLLEVIELRGWRPLAEGEPARAVRVLDLGAGAGAAGLGAAMLLHERGRAEAVELTAVDNSADHLARLATLVRENARHLPGLKVKTVPQNALDWIKQELPREEPFDLIVIGFALNEILPASLGLAPRRELGQQLRKKLTEAGLLLMLEPSFRETAEPLQDLSDALTIKSAANHVPMLPRWGPYFGYHRCPLRAEKVFWNHEVRRWKAPGSARLINQKLWREIDEVKFAYALHGRNPPPELPEPHHSTGNEPVDMTVRLVSPFHLRKGGFVAAAVGTNGIKYTLDLQTRGMSKEEIANLEEIERGDVLALRGLKELGTPKLMRLLTKEAIVARYHPD